MINDKVLNNINTNTFLACLQGNVAKVQLH